VVRGRVRGAPIYLLPRADGEIVVGASSHELGFDRTPRAGAVYELLRDAQAVFPELSEAGFAEVSTGLRPGSPDNAPLVGASGVSGLVLATGHYRNGVLLTPITADGITDLVSNGRIPEVLRPFGPDRFLAAAVR
jgi:glycine oxidase